MVTQNDDERRAKGLRGTAKSANLSLYLLKNNGAFRITEQRKDIWCRIE